LLAFTAATAFVSIALASSAVPNCCCANAVPAPAKETSAPRASVVRRFMVLSRGSS